MSIGIKNNL